MIKTMKLSVPDKHAILDIMDNLQMVDIYHILTIDPGIINFCYRLDRISMDNLDETYRIDIQNIKYIRTSIQIQKKRKHLEYDRNSIMFRDLLDDILSDIDGIIIVIIEDQIARNSKMMKVQRYLWQELFSRSLILISMSPSIKYSYTQSDKKTGWKTARDILEIWRDKTSIDILMESRKKDDLSDVVLMEYYFIDNHIIFDIFNMLKSSIC